MSPLITLITPIRSRELELGIRNPHVYVPPGYKSQKVLAKLMAKKCGKLVFGYPAWIMVEPGPAFTCLCTTKWRPWSYILPDAVFKHPMSDHDSTGLMRRTCLLTCAYLLMHNICASPRHLLLSYFFTLPLPKMNFLPYIVFMSTVCSAIPTYDPSRYHALPNEMIATKNMNMTTKGPTIRDIVTAASNTLSLPFKMLFSLQSALTQEAGQTATAHPEYQVMDKMMYYQLFE